MKRTKKDRKTLIAVDGGAASPAGDARPDLVLTKTVPGPNGPSGVAPDGNGSLSIIARGMALSGNISNRGDLHVDGKVDGDVIGGRIHLGDSGRVTGRIEANDVTISGILIGTVFANALTVTGGATITGDIYCERLTIADGAKMHGYCFTGPGYDDAMPADTPMMLAAAE